MQPLPGEQLCPLCSSLGVLKGDCTKVTLQSDLECCEWVNGAGSLHWVVAETPRASPLRALCCLGHPYVLQLVCGKGTGYKEAVVVWGGEVEVRGFWDSVGSRDLLQLVTHVLLCAGLP